VHGFSADGAIIAAASRLPLEDALEVVGVAAIAGDFRVIFRVWFQTGGAEVLVFVVDQVVHRVLVGNEWRRGRCHRR